MSILLDKRAEYQDKINQLVDSRRVEIEGKVALFRAQLEAEPIDGLADLQSVVDALNQVIAYEDEHCQPEVVVAEAPVVEKKVINIFQKAN